MLHTYFLGVLLCVGSGLALYDSSSNVVDLTPSNFDKLVTDSNDVWLVEFYAPWCGHCKNLVPEYKKAADALKGIAKVGAMDAEQHRSYAKNYGVTGFPTLKIFTGSKHTPYKGARTATAMVDACLEALKNKAYGRLGAKPDRSSEKQTPQTFGHIIQWKRVKQTTALPTDSPTTEWYDQRTDQETCQPDTLTTETTKEIIRMGRTRKTPIRKKHKPIRTTPKTTIEPSTIITTTTIPPLTSTPRLTVMDKFKILQNQLFRGVIDEDEKPKIMKALLRLKYVLQGRGVVHENATIVKRRSNLRKGRQRL